MASQEHDHSKLFSPVAGAYAQFRPHYPAALFDYLARLAPSRQMAWDCGCGGGQASVDLGDRFVSVLASDINAAQIANGVPHSHVQYVVAPAHESGLPDHSVDLVTVAQALHWFDLGTFYAEARRVLVPRGVIAVWSYGTLRLPEPKLDEIVQHFRTEIVGPYWPSERRHVDNGYRDLAFPWQEELAPDFAMEVSWSLPQLLGYLRSWSSSGRYHGATGQDPTVALSERLLPHWGDPYQARRITWPLSLRVGRNAEIL